MAVLMGIADGSDKGNEDGRDPIYFLSLQIQRPSGSLVAEATRALRSFSVHYMNLSHQTVFTCLGV